MSVFGHGLAVKVDGHAGFAGASYGFSEEPCAHGCGVVLFGGSDADAFALDLREDAVLQDLDVFLGDVLMSLLEQLGRRTSDPPSAQ